MKTDRKHFIKTGAAAFIASLGIKSLDAATNLPPVPNTSSSVVLPTNEEYWRAIRELFPLSKDFVYLNNGTLGPSPYPVIEAVKKGMQDMDQFANYGGWEHAANKLASFVGASENEIALTHNVTEGINIACWGLPLKKGDEVIMNTHEHVGNALPWLNRRKLHGIDIKTFTPAKTADETLFQIKQLLYWRLVEIACGHRSYCQRIINIRRPDLV